MPATKVTIERFPKTTVQLTDVESERDLSIQAGAVRSTIDTCSDPDNYILTTEWNVPGQNDGPQPPVVAIAQVDVGAIDYGKYSGGGNIEAWITQACQAASLPLTDAWVSGYKTLCLRESSFLPNAVNTTDRNAVGPSAADGFPQGCSRGVAQCIPATFAGNHVSGTSVSIYDPVANIAASMQYVRRRYNVSDDGSNLAAQVQQADPTRPRAGY